MPDKLKDAYDCVNFPCKCARVFVRLSRWQLKSEKKGTKKEEKIERSIHGVTLSIRDWESCYILADCIFVISCDIFFKENISNIFIFI